MRLNRFLASCGVASRRKCDGLIKAGRVKIDGKVVTALSTTVSPDKDRIEFDGKVLRLPGNEIFILLNKPKGYLSTVADGRGRPTVMDLIPSFSERLYPVGRLDLNSEGLLLLTNSGKIAFRLTHPKYGIEKVYLAEVKGVPDKQDLNQFEKGLLLEAGWTAPAKVEIVWVDRNRSQLKITLHEGRKRQVRYMCEAIGHRVTSLRRIQFGNLKLGNIELGKWRRLTSQEIDSLRKLVKLK